MLYQKYRPKTLDQIVGNEKAVSSLRSKLDSDDIPHVMLFTGPSGCGKTTLAHIVANTLECTGVDFREIDSAHFGGKDMIREVRRQTQYRPVESKCRVWFLDECHELSNAAQTALLTPMERPPKHVYFLFATTHPQKLIPTFKSRCTPFEVSPLSEKQLVKLIQAVCRAERKKTPLEVVQQIAHDSLGSARVALVILEKIIDLDKSEMLAAAKQSAAEESQVIELCRLLLKKGNQWKSICSILKGLDAEPETIRRAVLGYCASVLLNKDSPRASLIIDIFSPNFFDSGRAGLVAACYEVDHG